MTTAITVPDATRIEQESHAIVTTAKAMSVSSNADMQAAGEFLRRIKAARKTLDDTFDGPIAQAHKAHKAIVNAKKEHETPLADAERIVKGKVGEFTADQERLRREEEARQRQIAEQRRLEMEEERKREIALARQLAEQARLEEAERLEASGQGAAAEALLEAPVDFATVAPLPPPPVVVVPKTVEKVEGLSTRTVWKFRIVDASKIPLNYMLPDEKAIGAHARSMGARASIPGVEFYPEISTAVRS